MTAEQPYPNSEQDTLQRYFDATVTHLRGMRYAAKDPEGECVYRTVSGGHCAVGIHIPEDHPGMYCTGGVQDLLLAHPDLSGVALPDGWEGEELANQLQEVHDHTDAFRAGHLTSDAEAMLMSAAADHQLTYAAPDQVTA